MTETTGIPLPPPAPQNSRTWLVVVVVLVVGCCFCVGAVGLLIAFGEPLLNELGLYGQLSVLSAAA